MKNIKPIILSGFIAGTMDALAAIYFFTKPHSLHNISLVFRYILKGILGQGAYKTGFIYPLSGIMLHYLIAVIWSAFYLLIFSNVFKSGFILLKTVAFAALIWIIMNAFVLPISGVSSAHYDGWSVMKSFLILVVCVSLPIVVIAEKRK